MTAQPTHAQPFWQVQSVFDPDGTGGDFAYTIGLHTRGLPELHLWARPSLGEDPGEDWMLSPRDRCGVLNELAELLLSGQLDVGTELTREYDAGHARVTYRVDPPGDKEQLEAYGVPDGVDVLPVLWSLERAPDGPLRPLAAAGRSAAVRLFDELVVSLDLGRSAPPGFALPAEPDFAEDQCFGPLTPVVLARAAQLWQADDLTLGELLHSAGTARMGFTLTHPATVAAALARPVGRRHALRRVHAAAHELVDWLTTGAGRRRRWRAVVRALDPDWWTQLAPAGRRDFVAGATRLLEEMTVACLCTEAVADLADASLLLEGRGPWVGGLRHEQVLTLPEWQAAPPVQEAVRALLQGLGLPALSTVAQRHATAMRSPVAEFADYQDVCGRLQGWALVSAAACPWEPLLASLPGWRLLVTGLPGARLGVCPELHHWATCLTSALTHRARLSTDDVQTFSRLHQAELPGLVELLNRPL